MAELKDSYGRRISYLRISVTDKCNLRCRYCVSGKEFVLKKREEILSLEESERIARVGAALGINKIRFTGGEPLLRKGIDYLVEKISATPGISDLSLTTNGTLLKEYAARLREAGLKRINISLDTLNPARFEKMTRTRLWPQVMTGIEEALIRFDKVKLNVVAIRGTNDHEILDFVKFTRDKPIALRFIEFMPIGDNGWKPGQFISSSFVRSRIEREHELRKISQLSRSDSAELYQIEGFEGTLGFISAISQGFCENCNRLRLTADGFLKPCLSSDVEIDIKSKMRSGANDNELAELFIKALALKPREHNLLGEDGTKRRMFQIGG
ncbi:MAG: GTP 3',8-cyclase MoaA [Candidatus Zixiibacteriota bacterium]|nr:MAG: GTP 3',8-cyclase MoaA [candidate division Zixibacteria bacterium]